MERNEDSADFIKEDMFASLPCDNCRIASVCSEYPFDKDGATGLGLQRVVKYAAVNDCSTSHRRRDKPEVSAQ